MSDAQRLLELIEEGIVKHGGDLGGWTRCQDESLQLFDGRVTLHADVQEGPSSAAGMAVHAHVLTTLHEHGEEVLDACTFGMHDNREGALAQAAMIWITGVAGPIKSFLDNKPVCMTCQAGVAGGASAQGYSPGDYGLPGLRAFVGPSFARGFETEPYQAALDDTMPWFRYAAESAAPRHVHLAKATLMSKEGIWSREMEIDGHDVAHHDPEWPARARGPEFGYLTRYAVFEFPRNSAEIRRRGHLERTIRFFAENYSKYENVDHLLDEMVRQGMQPDLIHETESIATIAFGRLLFESYGVRYCPTIIRARKDGRVETDVPLMSIPAYTRGRAVAAQLKKTMPDAEFQALCCYNAESNAILKAMDAMGNNVDLSRLSMHPSVVPDREASNETMEAALAKLREWAEKNRAAKKKPWWKFW